LIPTLNLWLLFSGYLVIVFFFVVQRFLRRSEGAKSLRGGPYDRGNMILVGSTTGIGLWLPLIMVFLGVAAFPISLVGELVALAVMASGVGIRVWAAITLGAYYTTTLMTSEGQKVVTSGPYKFVRHPGHLGEIMIWTGLAVVSNNLVLLFLLPAMFVAVYLYRISAEERMLVKELGDDYASYQRRTRRLIPSVY
jgi:protein-S-isoprenylcysteine O-methyltransferase Ste14